MAEPIPIRQQIITALDMRLKTILTTNGYLSNIGTYVVAWQTNPTPIEDLNPAEIEYRDSDVAITIGPVGVHSHRMQVTLEVRIAGSTTIELLRKMEADIQKAIGVEVNGAAPPRWGGVAVITDPSRTVLRAEQVGDKAAGLTFEFFITFRTLEWDPYTAV